MDYGDRTLIETLQRQASTRPEAPAYQSGDQTLTFADLERETNRIANALSALGVRAGDRVACLTKHHVPCIQLMLAACKVRAVCMPVNWRLAPSEAEYVIRHGEAKLLLVDESLAAPFVAGSGTEHVPGGCRVLCTERDVGTLRGFHSWYAARSPEFSPVSADPDDSALQLYSSGTTGLPKGVVLTHRGLLSTCSVVSEEWQFGPGDVLGNPLPTFHVAGMTMLLLTLYAGGLTCAHSEFDPTAFIASIGRQRITHSFLVPAMLLFMLQSPAAQEGDYASLRLIAYGGSPISETVLQHAIDVFRCDFLQVYGLTEVSGPATFLMPTDHRQAAAHPHRLRSAGRPIGGCRLRIVDPVSGSDMPEGGTGEVWLETVRNLKEYWRDPDATRHAFPEGRNERGGWFRTGDGGYVEDGYLYINDRIKDMIISGGENIYPAEIENVLMKHPAVADGAIIGVPDTKWGEAVKACVVLRPGSIATGQEIMDWMRERLAHYKCPKTVEFVEALPRNPSGKILKRVLREPFWKGHERRVH
ncbi:MAG: o-succinylbenzoate--CoA ligase [Ramlibacter sp.]|nr:o-succinylbenzoate--CoA ligase [Ramlibacter sp.]